MVGSLKKKPERSQREAVWNITSGPDRDESINREQERQPMVFFMAKGIKERVPGA